MPLRVIILSASFRIKIAQSDGKNNFTNVSSIHEKDIQRIIKLDDKFYDTTYLLPHKRPVDVKDSGKTFLSIFETLMLGKRD